jgi:hypothetical protein
MDLELGGNIESDVDSSSDSDDDKEDQLMVDLKAGLHGNAVPESMVQPATTTKKYHSIAHDNIAKEKMVYVHVDVEDGGPNCVLLKISAVIMDTDLKIVGEFNEYVKPPENTEWDPHACRPHCLHVNHPSIVNADQILVCGPNSKATSKNTQRSPTK